MIDDTGVISPTQRDLDPVTRKEFREFRDEFDAFRITVSNRFKSVDDRFQDVDRRFDEIKHHAGILQEDLFRKIEILIESRMAPIDRISNHEVRISALETEFRFLKASRK